MRSIHRRTVLAAPLSLAAAPPPLNGLALNQRARKRGLFFGTAVSDQTVTKDKPYLDRIDAESGIVVGEAQFKWADTHPEPDTYDFTRADALMQFAAQRKLRVRGHTLVWHEANPSWLEPMLTPESAETILRGHIRSVTKRYAGRLAHWDVVNEVLQPDDKQPLGLRTTLWLRALGPAYLDIAFTETAACDPGALRVLNEFGTDYPLPWQERKRAALLALLADLRARKVPIQAVGLQAHLDAAEPIDQKLLAKFVADIAAMGLKIIVTELDVRDQRLPGAIEVRDTAIASHAKAWLDAVLASPAVLGVLTWGLSDRHSWLNEKFPREDKLDQRPLPLDAALERKPLWQAIAAALDAAPMR